MSHHYSITLGSPIYCLVFLENDLLLLGGGGGSSKSGVANKLWLVRLEPEQRTHVLLHEHALSRGSDAPMSIDLDRSSGLILAAINSPPAELKAGRNPHLRTFRVQDSSLEAQEAHQILDFDTEDDYQRITCLSPGLPRLLAVGGTNRQLKLLNYPSLKPAGVLDCPAGELLSVDFSQDGSLFLICSSQSVRVFALHNKEKPKKDKKKKKKKKPKAEENQEEGGEGSFELEPVHELSPPTDQSSTQFRNARLGRGPSADSIFGIINPKDRKKGSKLVVWSTTDGSMRRSRSISARPVTAFDVSESGTLLAIASSDLSVSVLDSSSLRPILSILHAHDFPVTALKFSIDSCRLISSSADTTVRVIDVPERRSPWRSSAMILFFLTILVLILSFLLSRYSDRISRLGI